MAGLSVVTRLDAEQAVVGSLLLDESLAPAILAAVDLADISGPANRRILQAARALLREAAPVDPITLRDKLGPESAEYVVQLMEITPTAANWRVYAPRAGTAAGPLCGVAGPHHLPGVRFHQQPEDIGGGHHGRAERYHSATVHVSGRFRR